MANADAIDTIRNEETHTKCDSEATRPVENVVTTSPKDWSRALKWRIAALVSLTQLITLMAASMPAPALPEITKDLRLSSTSTQIVFSIYFLGLGVTPICIAAISEIYGRKRVWIAGNACFVLWNSLCPVGSQKKTRVAFMVVGRFMAAAGASVGVTLSGPIMADIYTPEQRGWSLSLSQFAPYFGPALGPIVGGLMTQHVRWPWLFWTLSIFDATLLSIGVYALKETYPPTVRSREETKLKRRAAATLQSQAPPEHNNNDQSDNLPNSECAGGSDIAIAAKRDAGNNKSSLLRDIKRPLLILYSRPVIQLIALILLVDFGVYCIALSTFATMWIDRYNMSATCSSLNYISIALGSIFGTQIGGRLLDYTYRRLKARAPDGEAVPEFRIPPLVPGSILMPLGLIVYGWAVERHLPWIVADIGVFIFTFGNFGIAQALIAYVLDEFTQYAASAGAAARLFSYTAGFAFPIFAPQMYKRLGYGWANTLLAAICALIVYPTAAMLWKHGSKLRDIGKGPLYM